jgi:hypothetical protein
MDPLRAAFNGVPLEEQILAVTDWILNLRDKEKYLRRRRVKNLMVQAVITSTLMEAEALLKAKLRELDPRRRHRQRLK